VAYRGFGDREAVGEAASTEPGLPARLHNLHVIGAMWSLHDEPRAESAERVWGHVSRDGAAEVARALNEAVVAQRDRWPLHPSIWAGFAHVGP
jgi:hypothetical protein